MYKWKTPCCINLKYLESIKKVIYFRKANWFNQKKKNSSTRLPKKKIRYPIDDKKKNDTDFINKFPTPWNSALLEYKKVGGSRRVNIRGNGKGKVVMGRGYSFPLIDCISYNSLLKSRQLKVRRHKSRWKLY